MNCTKMSIWILLQCLKLYFNGKNYLSERKNNMAKINILQWLDNILSAPLFLFHFLFFYFHLLLNRWSPNFQKPQSILKSFTSLLVWVSYATLHNCICQYNQNLNETQLSCLCRGSSGILSLYYRSQSHLLSLL